MDLLRTAANAFIKLSAFEYRLVLSSGRNKPLDIIKINFIAQDLFHILGLQHLLDIDLPRNKKILLEKISKGNITEDYISKSEFYKNGSLGYNIRERIAKACYLEQYLDSDDFTVSVYKLKYHPQSFIRADYLITCRRMDSDAEYYIFIRRRKENNTYGIVSCFPKRDITYWGGKRYLMLKEKKKGNISCVLFKHPNYAMEQSFLKKQLEDAEASIREEGTISADDLEKELGV